MQSVLEQAIEAMDALLANKEYSTLLEYADSLLKKDVNNSQLLYYRIRALDGLGQGLSDIGFLRKYCWYRSLDAWGFFMLSKAYLALKEPLNAIVALVYANSIEPNNPAWSEALTETLHGEGYESVKLAILRIDRIGHLAFEPDAWLRFKSLQQPDEKELVLFICDEPTKAANLSCYQLISRYLTIVSNPYWMRIIKTRPSLLNARFYCSMPYDSVGWSIGLGDPGNSILEKFKDTQSLYHRCPAIVSLTDEEISSARTMLSARGIDSQSSIVCLHVRDSAYLESMTPGAKEKDVRKHDYRDADISSYLPAIEYLLDKGYTVLRVGTITNQPLALEHPRYFEFFDRPLEPLLDVYIASICRFYMGTNSGPFAFAGLFDKPALITNGVPLMPFMVAYCRTLPKVFIDPNGQELSFIELMDNKHFLPDGETSILECLDGTELQKYGYAWRDNTEREILSSVIEFESELESHILRFGANSLQTELASILSQDSVFKTSTDHVTGAFISHNCHLFQGLKSIKNEV